MNKAKATNDVYTAKDPTGKASTTNDGYPAEDSTGGPYKPVTIYPGGPGITIVIQGWECPRCKKINNPTLMQCLCKPTQHTYVSASPTGETPAPEYYMPKFGPNVFFSNRRDAPELQKEIEEALRRASR